MKKSVLILCTGNSCRSQMAEGIARDLFGVHYDIFSAGTHPSVVHPLSVAVMKEIDIDISYHRSKSVSEFYRKEFDYILTVCGNADQNCPAFPGKAKRVHWGFPDPAHVEGEMAQIIEAFRMVRDFIYLKIEKEWLTTFC